MKHYHWKSKPFAIVTPKRGQKGQVAKFCAILHVMNRQLSVELLAGIFGISPATVYREMAAARPQGRSNGHARTAKGNGHCVIDDHQGTVKPSMPAVELGEIPMVDPWAIAENLVHAHGVDQVFDRVIMPAIR